MRTGISRKLLRYGMAAVVAAGAVSAVAPPAQAVPARAASHPCKKYWVGESWGCYQKYGDIFRVSDGNWDGWGVRVRWTTTYGRKGTCDDPNGSDNGTVTCNYNFREGSKTGVTFRVEEIDDGEIGDTSGWQFSET